MSFLQAKRTSIYLEVTNAPKFIRPLNKETDGRWVYSIPSCSIKLPNGKTEVLRRYTAVDADFSDWMSNNPDPLWDKLDSMDQVDRNGQRRDFPMRPINILPVWDYSANDGKGDVRIVKQGNQFFEEMVKWYDQGHDVTACDWACWTEGTGRFVTYKTSRQDQSPFNASIDPQTLQQKYTEMMSKALSDLRPFKTEEEMLNWIYGQSASGSASFNLGTNVQNQMPGYQPGGQSVGPQLGGIPTQQAPVYPGVVPQTTTNQHPPVQPGVVPQTTTNQQSPVQPGVVPQIASVQSNNSPITQWTPPVPQQQVAPQNLTPIPTVSPNNGQAWVPPVPQQSMAQPNLTPIPPNFPNPTPVVQPPQEEVPNAPVSSQPVYPIPAPATAPMVPQSNPTPAPVMAQGNPAAVVVSFGKYEGKTLGWVLDNDPAYLSYLKGSKKELAADIENLLSMGKPINKPSNGTNGTNGNNGGNGKSVQNSLDEETIRQELVQKLNEKFLSIEEFQGPGILNNMMPFLEQTIGTTDFSDAPLADLQKLEVAVNARTEA